MFPHQQQLQLLGCNYAVTQTQLPLRLAFSVTVHKIQGCTLDKVAIDCSDRFFDSGQMYTALTRVKHINNLCLLHFDRTTFPKTIILRPYYRALFNMIDDYDQLNPESILAKLYPPWQQDSPPIDDAIDNNEPPIETTPHDTIATEIDAFLQQLE